jgi:uncharacterized membrane protein YbhN (UPF0104 family)
MAATAIRPPGGISHRRVVPALLLLLLALGLLYGVVPRIAGFDETWRRLSRGDPWWLLAALAFELGSFSGYVALFRHVFAPEAPQIGWGASWRISLAGVTASRLLSAGGAGGIALTAWALHRAGIAAARVTARLTAFLVLLYAVYMAALVLVGAGLRTGVLSGRAPTSLTVAPALLGAAVIAVALLATRLPADLERRLGTLSLDARLRGRVARWLVRGLALLGEGVRVALALVRVRDPALLGAIAWWALDVAALWACLHAFGGQLPGGVVVMAYFVGMIANLLPVPGGVGAVEGGMIGALVAFGAPAGTAIAGVLAYRVVALWLPALAGVIAYVQLMREAARQVPAGTAVPPTPSAEAHS